MKGHCLQTFMLYKTCMLLFFTTDHESIIIQLLQYNL